MSVKLFKNGKLTSISGPLYTPAVFPGQIVMGANANAPIGWLLCNGQQLDKKVFNELYDAIGDNYTKPDTPAGFFNVPDMSGRVPYGMGITKEEKPLSYNMGDVINESLPNHNHDYKTNRRLGANGTLSYEVKYIDNEQTKQTQGVNSVYDKDGNEILNTIYQNGAKVHVDGVVLNYFIKY